MREASALTSNPIYQAAVTASHQDLTARRNHLLVAARANARDVSETDTERTNLQNLLQIAIEHYDYYRDGVYRALLRLGPGVRLSAAENHRRERLHNRYFELSASMLAKQAVDKQSNVLQAALAAFKTEPELQALGYEAQFEPIVRPVVAALRELQRETREDLIATQVLRQARHDFDLAHRFHIQLVEALLNRESRFDEAGHFIKRRDPAYAARRRAKAPIAQEPDAAELEAEILRDQEPATT